VCMCVYVCVCVCACVRVTADVVIETVKRILLRTWRFINEQYV